MPRNHELTRLEESNMAPPPQKKTKKKRAFSSFIALFNITEKFSLLDLEENRWIRDFEILTQNHGLTPLEKSNIVNHKIELVKKRILSVF